MPFRPIALKVLFIVFEKKFITLIYFVCVYVCVLNMCYAYMHRSEEILQESVLSFHLMGFGDVIQVNVHGNN